MRHDDRSISTHLMHAGSDPKKYFGMLNTPIFKSTTIVKHDLDYIQDGVNLDGGLDAGYNYGRNGTPNAVELSKAIGKLEEAEYVNLTNSGVTAVAISIMAIISAGDHILVIDNLYDNSKAFITHECKKYNISSTFFGIKDMDNLECLIQKNTKIIILEPVSSNVFEVYDIPKIIEIAKRKGIITIVDNSYPTPIFYKPLEKGADISLQSCSKYINGNGDVLLGSISTNNKEIHEKISKTRAMYGIIPSPDDCYNVMKGLRTLEYRVKIHQHSAMKIARWLEEQDCVSKVLYPALESHPQHEIWKRDFTGATGVFSFILKKTTKDMVKRFVHSLELFHSGLSWGVFCSLIVPIFPKDVDNNTQMPYMLRMSIGLENPDDLVMDLSNAIKSLYK